MKRGNDLVRYLPWASLLGLVLALLLTQSWTTNVMATSSLSNGVTASFSTIHDTLYFTIRPPEKGSLALEMTLGQGSHGALAVLYDESGSVVTTAQRNGPGRLGLTVPKGARESNSYRLALVPLGSVTGLLECEVASSVLPSLGSIGGLLPIWAWVTLSVAALLLPLAFVLPSHKRGIAY